MRKSLSQRHSLREPTECNAIICGDDKLLMLFPIGFDGCSAS